MAHSSVFASRFHAGGGVLFRMASSGLFYLGLCTVVAAQPFVELSPAPASVSEHQVKVGVTAFSTEIRLRNASKDAPRYHRTGSFLTRASDNAARPAVWKRVTSPTDDNSMSAGAQVALELSGDLPEAGIYETSIDTYSKDGSGAEVPDRRIRVLVTREADALPSELMVDPKATAERWPWNSGNRAYTLTLRNTATKVAAFGTPQIVSFTRKSGDGQVNVGATDRPLLDSAPCGSSLGPNKSCPIYLMLRSWLEPGEYMIDVGLGGAGGGWSQRTQVVRVRATALLAFAIIIVGAAAGWYVQSWRTRGRRAVAALMDIARLRQRLERLVARAKNDLAALMGRAVEEIDDIELRCRKDVDVTGDISGLDRRIRHLGAATDIEDSFDRLPGEGQNALRPRRNVLMEKIAKRDLTDADRTALEALAQALANDVSAWPKLAQSIQAAMDLAAALEVLRGAATLLQVEPAGLHTQRDALNTAIDAAQATLSAEPANDSVLSRRDTLEDALKKASMELLPVAQKLAEQLSTSMQARAQESPVRAFLEKLNNWRSVPPVVPPTARIHELVKLWKENRAILGGKEADLQGPIVVPGGQQVDFPPALLLPNFAASLAELEKSQRRDELLTNGLILVATGLAGVLALWVPNATWGSVGDLIAAFLAGLAARVVVGEAGSASQATGVVR